MIGHTVVGEMGFYRGVPRTAVVVSAAGAIVGQIIGKNSKETIIGAVVGAAAGGAYAAATKDGDISLPAGTHILVTIQQRLNVSRS